MLSVFKDYRLIWDTLDIAIVAYIIYRLFLLIRGTRAVQLVKGLFVLLLVGVAARILELTTVIYILDYVQMALIVAVPVVFQPELRRALEQLGRVGRGGLFASAVTLPEAEVARVIDDIATACDVLGRNKIGALIVVERETGLKDIAETGTAIDGLVSSAFLINIFVPNAPLHDGAVIIRGNRVAAAGCFLPLSENPDLSRELGTRHRAAVGMTEQSDALVVVVSEETGWISLANAGKLIRHLDDATLREMLENLMKTETSAPAPFRPLGLDLFGLRQTGRAGSSRRKGGGRGAPA
ncbi:MAG TPA: TIGR00159 family protein [Clostridiales bacterium]|nr:TIGR00159 family protein [Clostridiales bacterium]